MPSPEPSLQGKYEILEKLGGGAMGEVYKVRHRLLGEVQVVKVVHLGAGAASAAGERFLREARSAIQLRHPNVAHLHDFSVEPDGTAFIAMEMIEGVTLEDLLARSGPPPVALALAIGAQALAALGFLHRRGFVHRDIAPDNLMLTEDVDGGPLVKLIDLGLAKLLGGAESFTVPGTFLAQPLYASPEQLSPEARVDGRSDLYSFGVVLYELLTGRHPFVSRGTASLIADHLFRPPLDFAESDPEGRLPADLRAVLLAALAKKPEDRIATAEEFASRLEPIRARFPLPVREPERTVIMPAPLVRPAPEPAKPPAPAPAAIPAPVPAAVPAVVSAASTSELPTFPPSAGGPPAATRPAPSTRKWLLAAALLGLAVVAAGLWFTGNSKTLAPGEDRAAPPAAGSSAEPPATEPVVPPAATGPAPAPAEVSRPVEEAVPPPPPAPVPVRQEPPPRSPEPAPRPVEPAPRPAPAPVEKEPAKPERAKEEPPKKEPAKQEPPKKSAVVVPLVTSGRDFEDAQPLAMPEIAYPEAALGSGKHPWISVEMVIDEKGQVVEARVEGTGDTSGLGFNEAAREAAMKVRFKPATQGGVPVRTKASLTFKF